MNTTITEPPSLAASSADAPAARWFLNLSLISLVGAFGLLAIRPEFVMTSHLTPEGLAWLLLLVFGTGLSGVFAVIYEAIPRFFGPRTFSRSLVLLHFGFHLAGTALTCAAAAWPEQIRGGHGSALLVCGAVVFAINLTGAFRGSADAGISAAALALSGLWLLVIALAGVPFAEKAPVEFLEGSSWSASWLVLALAGVLINAPLGIGLRVLPGALGLPAVSPDRALGALVLSNLGLAWMAAAVAFGPPGFAAVCSAVYALGMLFFLGEFVSLVRRRPSTYLPWDVRIFLSALFVAPVPAALVLWSVWERLKPVPVVDESVTESPAATALEFLRMDGSVVLTALLAVAIPAILALAFQLVRLGDASRTEATVRGRLPEPILLAAFFNYAAGVLLVVPAALAGIERIVGLGSLFLLAGALGFLGNLWWQKSRTPTGNPIATGSTVVRA